jgi:hypothetical protein
VRLTFRPPLRLHSRGLNTRIHSISFSALEVVGEESDEPLPTEVRLPSEDQPILRAAIRAGATHLLTGDVRHFGPCFGSILAGVRILPPGDYLREISGPP